MSKPFLKDLPELIEAGIITHETADKIKGYYQEKIQHSPNRLVLVFGIFGALLTGLGIILIIAHNWDDLSKPLKLALALFPLFLGQLICAYTLFKKNNNFLWRETGSVFLFFAIAASISIVSQVYNIPGDLSGFLFIWMLLSIPLIYTMQSAMTSLLVIGGITWYACSWSYFDYPTHIAWYYWLMLASIIPFFTRLQARKRNNFSNFHGWFLCSSVIITLAMFSGDNGYIFIAYISLFSLLLLLGEKKWFAQNRPLSNAFLVTGSLGSTILLLMLTFEWMWSEVAQPGFVMSEDFFVSVIISLLATLLLIYEIRLKGIRGINPKGYVFIVFILLFLLGQHQPVLAQWLTNFLVLMIAVITTWRGAEQDNLLILNYGLLIMTALILCRFFDTDLSFVARGVLFMMVGLSFFGANYWLMKKRKLQNV